LHNFWADQGCIIWRPHNIQVGAGTGNPATLLRVLGPEPWRVAYIEPSVRPDDGRYGENPNRFQMHTQYQVILKPDPGNPQELYLASLEAIGLNPREHDIRFVEDNWESPALGAWGLGWEVWLDGQEITQFTYFQQAGGIELNPTSVEITYGLERIVLALQGKNTAWEMAYMSAADSAVTYQDIFLRGEFEHSKYYFEIADIDGLRQSYDIYEGEYRRALEAGTLMPAYDYVLKCSHVFNVLDTRGAIGVTERAKYFRRMRDMTRDIAKAVVEQRQSLEYPLDKMSTVWASPALGVAASMPAPLTAPADFLLEIGVEELPADNVDTALEQLQPLAEALLTKLRLTHNGIVTYATPRRMVIWVKDLAAAQTDSTEVAKGPSADRAFDPNGKPTKAAEGFARSKGIDPAALRIEELENGRYVVADVFEKGRPAAEVLAEALPSLIADIKFGKNMRWNSTNVAFSRPVRWIVALHGNSVVPFVFAGAASGNITRGLRPFGSPEHTVNSVADYMQALESQGIVLDRATRRATIIEQVNALAASVNGKILLDEGLLDEVANLVERPTALLGTFNPESLELPPPVLITVMRKHQRYFAVTDADGKLLPYFVAVRNGDSEYLDTVQHGNEHVLRARFADARFFYNEDIKKPLKDFLPRLNTLTFHEKIGSMLEKNNRVAALVSSLGELLGTPADQIAIAVQAAQLAKADLATQMVVEMTSLQGVMGREYALREGTPAPVADAIFEHWLPRSQGDLLPASAAGTLLAITDRLDTLAGLFAAGLAPKGSADPFGLRRAALGIVQILTYHGIEVDLRQALALIANGQPIPVIAEIQSAVMDFVRGRLEVWLLDQNWPHDVVQAVLSQQAHNPTRTLQGITELSLWVKRPDWEVLLDGFARCVRITRSETAQYSIQPDLFVEAAERDLYAAVQAAHAQLDDSSNVGAFLSAFEPALPAVTQFFVDVLVMAEDAAVRQNRLGLLQSVAALAANRADLSHLSGF
ncbi:MAG: glycine--tRNA ligase subunit beta, partial [Phototrophicaceae bacterium]